MIKFLGRFKRDESGATAVEYALLAALMAGVIIAAVATFGDSMSEAFGNIGTTLTTETAPEAGS